MKNTKLLTILMIIFLVIPITSAIYIGEATSEPTIITLTIGTIEDDEDNNNDNPKDIPDNRFSQPEAQRIVEEQIESDLREVTYSDWICINNKLQREIKSLNHIKYEYGQTCGFEIPNESVEKTETNIHKLFFTINLLLVIFIILSLILIITIVLTKN